MQSHRISRRNTYQAILFLLCINNTITMVPSHMPDQHGLNQQLISQAEAGNTEQVKQLLVAEQTDVDTVDTWGQTSLFYAAREGHAAIVTLLIQAGANVNHVDKLGHSALTVAVREGDETVVRALFERGAHQPTPQQWDIVHDDVLFECMNYYAALAANPSILFEHRRSLVHKYAPIATKRTAIAAEYFAKHGMPQEICRLIQQMDVDGMPAHAESKSSE